jgi:hypothetical protein
LPVVPEKTNTVDVESRQFMNMLNFTPVAGKGKDTEPFERTFFANTAISNNDQIV